MDEKANDCVIFESKTYEFLSKTLSQNAKTRDQLIGCFDVNRNFFVFGSKSGEMHYFGRHQTDCKKQYKNCQLISSAINHVSIISYNLLSFASDFAIYVINWKINQFIYCWKSTTNAKISAIQTYMDSNEENTIVISGDSSGVVRCHDITSSGEQTIIFCENGFEIVQIEFIDRDSVIISSTLRSVILRLDSNEHCLAQIGKNERKKPSRYGAVYSVKDNVVYASRPSLHLSKADAITGDVIETIRVNNISQSNTSDLFNDNISGESKTDKTIYKLGVLSSFCGDNYLISCNNSQLLIIESNGEYCYKAKIDDLICVKTSHRDSNEVFLLLNSNDIIQLKNKSWICSTKDNNNHISGDTNVNLDLFRSNSSEALLSMFNPINSKVVSFIDDRVKRTFDKIHSNVTNVTKKFDQLSTSIISSISNINHNYDSEINNQITNSFEAMESGESVSTGEEVSEEIDVSPIVVIRKNKKRNQEKAKISAESNSDNTDSLSKISIEEESLPTKTSNLERSVSFVSESNTNNSDSVSKISIEEESLPTKITNYERSVSFVSAQSLTDEVSDDRLQAILNAYKEANHESRLENSIEFELSIDSNHWIKNFDLEYNNDETVLPIHDSGTVANISDEKTSDNKSSDNELKWRMVFNPYIKKYKYNLLSICVNGYNSDKEMGLMWFTGTRDNQSDTCLLYYPYLMNELKLPPKTSVCQFTANFKDLYILCMNGYIYKREGIDACKPLGTKWISVKLCKSKAKLKSISLNNSNGIVWCCDGNGEAWTLNTKNQSWLMINDFSSHSIEFSKVCVALNDHSIVWAIDKRGKIFVRLFKVGGDSWLLVDGILATDLVVCDRYVWIVVERTKLYRRSNICDTNYDVNEWKRVELAFDSSNELFQSISVSDNNELWILTDSGFVWRSVNDDSQQSRDVEKEWFLV